MATEAQKRAKANYRKKLNRIMIDFYPADEEIWNHLQAQEKKQTYIKDLIRKDMAIQRIRYKKKATTV